MIRPFGLNDIGLVLSLQRRSVALAVEHILTHPRAPLWIALTAPWPWAGVGVATYVLNEKCDGTKLAGFVQLMKRAARPEADLLHLAPVLHAAGLDESTGTAIWERLLAHCASAAASNGLQRVFASIPHQSREESRLRDAGFSLYALETIYRLAMAPDLSGADRPPPSPRAVLQGPFAAKTPAGFRRQAPKDSWALQRLYTRGTPLLVQQAEGAVTGLVGSPPLSWWEPDRWLGLVWEPAGEVRGAVQVHIGRAGHWLRVWGANMLTPRELRSLIGEGLRAITGGLQGRPYGMPARVFDSTRRRRPLPIYVTVRDYEFGLGSVLTGFGFAPYAQRARLVRHTVAVVREPLRSLFSGLEVEDSATVAQPLSRSAQHTGSAPVRLEETVLHVQVTARHHLSEVA